MSRRGRPYAGYSLLSIMIGAAIIGVLAIGFARLMSSSYRAQRDITQSGGLQEALATLSTSLRRPQTCVNNFIRPGNPPFQFPRNPSTPPSLELSEMRIYAEDGSPGPLVLKVGEPASSRRPAIAQMMLTGFFRIDDSHYSATLRINAQRELGNAPTSMTVVREIGPLFFTTSTVGGNVTLTGCDGEWNAPPSGGGGTGPAPGTQQCPANQYMVGLNLSTGTPVCSAGVVAQQPTTPAPPPAPTPPPSGGACATNTSAPSYCSNPYYSSSATCVRAHPSYCSNPYYANASACDCSNPSYCSNPYYANALACRGTMPSYCTNPYYANALACAPR